MTTGFYGSLSKLQKINFQFDRVFPNRAAMDQEAELGYYISGDGQKLEPVLTGRFVLVDYHEGDVLDKAVRIGYDVNGEIMAAPGVPFGDNDGISVSSGNIITVIGSYDAENTYMSYAIPKMYRYPNLTTPITYTSNNNPADSLSVYEKNLIIDGQQYTNIGRGWDSTVWQKTYQGGKARYIMIAELNALSPTLALGLDAPTVIPNNPYFGTDSTLNFYRLHIQPNWGMRIKGAQALTKQVELNNGASLTSRKYSADTLIYPSDVKGEYVTADGTETKDLAIYYNEKGFNRFLRSSNALDSLPNDQKGSITKDGKAANFISVTPTGRSGKLYGGFASNSGLPSEDTNELSIMLPSLGETISKVWDLIYGQDAIVDNNGNHLYYNGNDLVEKRFSAVNNKFRNTDIYWNSTNGIRYTKTNADGSSTYNPDNLKTLAGIINSSHDLMGMIIRKKDNFSDVADWDPTKIYYVNGRYYIKNKVYNWQKYTPNEVSDTVYQKINNIIYLGQDVYRATEEEYPYILDSEIVDLEDFQEFFGDSYENYEKVLSTEDLIEGARYGTVSFAEADSNDRPTPDTTNYDYYKFDTVTQDRKRYLYVPDIESKEGIFYAVPKNISSLSVDATFYIPNKYWVKDSESNIRLATEETLEEIVGSSSYPTNNVENNVWTFYSKITPVPGSIKYHPVLVRDTNGDPKYHVKLCDIDDAMDDYTTTPGTLKIYAGTADNKILAENIDMNSYINGTSVIIYDNNEKPIKYYAALHNVQEDNENHFTLKEIINNGYTESGVYYIYEYIAIKDEDSYTVKDTDAIAKLRDFEENRYYFQNNAGTDDKLFQLEIYSNLFNEQGDARNKNHSYFDIAFNENNRQYFYSKAGSYVEIKDGTGQNARVIAYRRNFTPHVQDPNPIESLRSGAAAFNQIAGARPFIPNLYYKIQDGKYVLASAYEENVDYYERIGNIVNGGEPDWPDGYEWDDPIVPANGLLGQRTITWEAKEIKGMAKDFNTMHGLILRIYQLLQSGDANTRDSNTVQGILNQCKDILAVLKSRGYSFHSVDITGSDNTVSSIVAQTADAAIKLKSNTKTVELSADVNDNISLDLAEQYRKWVIPNGDSETDITTLSFTDGEDNTKAVISVDEDGIMDIQANSLTLSDGEAAWFSATSSGVTYNGKPLLVSESEDPISFGWDSQNKTFTIYSNGTPIVQIKKQED